MASPLESPITHHPSRLFVLVAGEASGDLLGAGLIQALRERYPDARFAGIGGPRMIAAGLEAWYPAERLAVMGLVEVLPRLFELLAIRRDVARRAIALRPDAFIGIDAPDFNLGLERKLKRAGVRTLHYVSPSIWAWREKRAAKIGRSADRVLCLFPMEPPIYARHGVDARFVGHPLADAMPLEPDQADARAALGLPHDAPVLALLPGSRLGEIARLGADFIAATRLLAGRVANLRVVAPMANEECRAAFAALARDAGFAIHEAGTDPAEAGDKAPIVRLLSPQSPIPNPQSRPLSHLAMFAADAVLLASGTAALEAMLAKRPMVVAYRIAPTTYRIVKGLGLLKTERYALPNILAGRELVPERMQDDCTPPALAEALAPSLLGRDIDPALLAEYRRLHLELRHDADRSAASAIADVLDATTAARAA
ncbi:lipid-A-disaccharide synthase [Dokdonella sp.]|uniref:lipid-A-disaccharide synthase n=1 Tax=Dokdonella sp. TaxID=2291710 RepID=UPI001B2D61A7|nr:lipid-A-disaccharide synthase [Dokdonella sp.]MBO9662938.1 lipid-A-disaccharide synthase [Dokdonella sp.]